jgi:hypothetical protein
VNADVRPFRSNPAGKQVKAHGFFICGSGDRLLFWGELRLSKRESEPPGGQLGMMNVFAEMGVSDSRHGQRGVRGPAELSGVSSSPGVYRIRGLGGRSFVYIGESADLRRRLLTHYRSPVHVQSPQRIGSLTCWVAYPHGTALRVPDSFAIAAVAHRP